MTSESQPHLRGYSWWVVQFFYLNQFTECRTSWLTAHMHTSTHARGFRDKCGPGRPGPEVKVQKVRRKKQLNGQLPNSDMMVTMRQANRELWVTKDGF